MSIFMGILLIILGIMILGAPVVAGMASVMAIGAIMIIAGIIELVKAFKAGPAIPKVVWLLVGLVTALSGVLVLAHPIFGLGFLTLLLAVYFFTDGIVKIGAAFRYDAGRAWFVSSGILSFILAYLIWINWPLSGGWAIGVLVGINFIVTGILMLTLGEL
jgi:membrane protein HdeD